MMNKATLSSPERTNDLVKMVFNVGVVGCGRWGTKHLETLALLKHQGVIDEIYACDINRDRLEKIHPAIDEVFRNWTDMCQSVQLDLVSIVTQNSSHLSLGVAMLEQGLNVLIEKPLGASFDEVKRLCEAAKMSTGTLHSGYLLRHHPGVKLAKKLIEDHSIGRVKSVRFTKYSSRKKPSNANAIENLVSHAFSIIPSLITPSKSPLFSTVMTLEDGQPAPLTTAPQAIVHLTYPGQATNPDTEVEVNVGWQQADCNLFTIEGTKQHIRLNFREHNSIELGTQKTGYRAIPTLHPISPLEAQYRYILSNTHSPHVLAEDHLQTAELLDKATSLAQYWYLHNAWK